VAFSGSGGVPDAVTIPQMVAESNAAGDIDLICTSHVER